MHAASDTPPPVRGLRGARSARRRRLARAKHTQVGASFSHAALRRRRAVGHERQQSKSQRTQMCNKPRPAVRLWTSTRCWGTPVREALHARFKASQFAAAFIFISSLTANEKFPQLLMPSSPGWRQRCALEAAAGRERQAGVSLRSCAPFCSCATSDVSPPTRRNIRQPTAHDKIWRCCGCCIQ